MSDMLWLIQKTLRSTFRTKSSWFLYAGLPLIGILLSLLLYGNETGGALRVGIANLDGEQAITADAIAFVERLNNTDIVRLDESKLREQITAGKLDSGLVIPKGFAESVKAGKPEPISVVSVKGAAVTGYVSSMLQNYVGNIAAIGQSSAGDAAAFDRLYGDYSSHTFKLSTETVSDSSNKKDITYQSIGFLLSFMMLSSITMSGLILREKENRTFLRLLSSPITARTYVLANVVVNALIMLLQIIVTLLIMRFLLQIDSGIPFGQLLLLLLLFSLAAIGLSLLVVAFARSSSAASAMQNLIVTPTCLLAGCFFPIDIMPDTVRKISNFMPQHWLLDAVNKLHEGHSFGSLYLNMLILLAFAAAFTIIAIYRFGRNNDTASFV